MEGAIPENMQGVQSFSGWFHQSSDCFVSNLCMKVFSSATQLSMEDSWLGIRKSRMGIAMPGFHYNGMVIAI